jgi:hypothetical protein
MQIRALLCCFTILFLYGGCKNDLDLLDDYHSSVVCYGLLNPADSVHYVRVTKVFLGEGDALVMAQNPDSISFPVGSISVTIEEWKNGLQMQNYTMTADSSIPRDTGVFQYPHQLLYRARFPVLKDGSTYKLKVVDLVKGITYSSETPIVTDIGMVDPAGTFSALNLTGTTSMHFIWKSGTNGIRYNFKIRFHYKEEFLFDTTQVSDHFVDWEIGDFNALTASGNENMTVNVVKDNFLRMIAQKIPANGYVRRISGNLDFIFLGAAQDFATYIDVTDANNNTSAAIPPFSNIRNGYGLFSSRTTTVLPGYSLDSDTRYQLRVNPIVYGTNFVR